MADKNDGPGIGGSAPRPELITASISSVVGSVRRGIGARCGASVLCAKKPAKPRLRPARKSAANPSFPPDPRAVQSPPAGLAQGGAEPFGPGASAEYAAKRLVDMQLIHLYAVRNSDASACLACVILPLERLSFTLPRACKGGFSLPHATRSAIRSSLINPARKQIAQNGRAVIATRPCVHDLMIGGRQLFGFGEVSKTCLRASSEGA